MTAKHTDKKNINAYFHWTLIVTINITMTVATKISFKRAYLRFLYTSPCEVLIRVLSLKCVRFLIKINDLTWSWLSIFSLQVTGWLITVVNYDISVCMAITLISRMACKMIRDTKKSAQCIRIFALTYIIICLFRQILLRYEE